MLAYHCRLALRSFSRNKVLTGLMVLSFALGIGAFMTMLTVYSVLSRDPIPHKSGMLFYPRLESRDIAFAAMAGEPDMQMKRRDAETLLREKRADRQALMSQGYATVDTDDPDVRPSHVQLRYTSADFFPMFEPPMLHGRAWTKAEDASRSRVVVITRELNDRLFGGKNGVGKTLRLNLVPFRVIGVLDAWQVNPRFYDLTMNRFGKAEQVFMPFSTSRELSMAVAASIMCWGEAPESQGGPLAVDSPCTWVQYWVELRSPEKVEDYRRYLENYSAEQRKAGRFGLPTNVLLHDVNDWLRINEVVPEDVRMQTWLAFGLLAVCLLNTIGLLLAKFLHRAPEIGVRRALGASRRTVFAQYLVEAAAVGAVGGVLGMGFACFGLWVVRQQPTSYAELAAIEPRMLVAAVVLTFASSLLSGLIPAWRACQIAPAIQLKSQ